MPAQSTQLSLSGTYGIVGIDYQSEYNPDKEFKAIGTSLGLELKFGNHFTLGGDVDWQRLESELAIAEPLTSPNLPDLIYSIDRHQFNIRPTFRYYFKEAFRGLYVGAFGTYSYLTVKTSDYPKDSKYFPDLYSDPSDDFGLGGGLTYGFRYKLTSTLQVSAFGSHQLFWNDIPEFRQQDHQFGLGLNWTL
ncbi:MAG: DUF3575 domain-containing protein [Phycisphaerae bacterium]|nr:DUF3575 domain-containing protein [Saprospiraceae bacterium]